MMSEKALIVTVGLPRSGKSTGVDEFINRQLMKHNYQVICADDIRLALGVQFFQPLENFVWGVHDTMVRAALIRNFNVIIDGTNTTPVSLKKYADMAEKYNFRFGILFFDTPIDICIERNHGEGAVPENVIHRMNDQLKGLQETRFWNDHRQDIIVSN